VRPYWSNEITIGCWLKSVAGIGAQGRLVRSNRYLRTALDHMTVDSRHCLSRVREPPFYRSQNQIHAPRATTARCEDNKETDHEDDRFCSSRPDGPDWRRCCSGERGLGHAEVLGEPSERGRRWLGTCVPQKPPAHSTRLPGAFSFGVRYIRSTGNVGNPVSRPSPLWAVSEAPLRPHFEHRARACTLSGAWLIVASERNKGGQFPSRQEAIDYARRESGAGNFVIIHYPAGLEWQEGHPHIRLMRQAGTLVA
jgi:hypothetical protein